MDTYSFFCKILEHFHKTTKVSSHKSNTNSNLSFNTCLYQYFTREGLKAAGKSTPVQDTQIHNATVTMQFREAGVYYHPKAAGLKTDSVMKHRGILCPLLCIPCGIFALLQGSLWLQWGFRGQVYLHLQQDTNRQTQLANSTNILWTLSVKSNSKSWSSVNYFTFAYRR